MKYTFVKQHDITDCAAACMAMVCLHYKKETTITRLRDVMGTDIKGTNLIGMRRDMRKNHPTKLELLGRIRKNQLSLQVNQFSLQ